MLAPRPSRWIAFLYFNRATYSFNKAVDRVALKPTARAYEALIPKPIQILVGNFFKNLSDIPTTANDVLQGRLAYASLDMARFLLNSTWGIGGLFDVAGYGQKGIPKRDQDFGLTLAHWGYKHSSYVVLPLLGPSTVRDGVGRLGHYYLSAPTYLKRVEWKNRLFALNLIDTRVSLLKLDPTLSDAMDEYVFVREAYLQHRQYLINGGHAPASENLLLGEPPE